MFVDGNLCVGCAACITACRKGAISILGRASIDQEKCTSCKLCIAYCPNDAIGDAL